MNTVRMGSEPSESRHLDEFVMILDGAGSHKAEGPAVPENMGALRLAAYTPELNLRVRMSDQLRDKESPNGVFNHTDSAVAQLHSGSRACLRIMIRFEPQRHGRG